MNHKITRLMIYCLCLTYSLSAIASSSDDITKQAQALIANDDYNGAYEVLTPVADTYSDEADFNYLYGSILLKLRKYSLAVFALERALFIRPDHTQTMEALAQGYNEIKEFAKAEQLFAKIKEKTPPGFFANTAQQLKNLYLQTEDLYTFSSFLGTTLGYDSNLTSGPINSYITIPAANQLGALFVGNDLQKDDDFFTTVNGGANLDFKVNERYGINMGMYGSHRLNYQRSDQDLAFLSGWLGGSYQQDKNRFDLNIRRQSIWLSEEDYQDQYSAFGQWSRTLQTNTVLSLYTQLSTLRYPNAKTLDGDSYLLGTALRHQLNLPFTPLLSAEIYGGELRIKAGGDSAEGYESIGGRLTSQLHFNENSEFLVMGTVEDRRYKAENLYFLTTRADKGYSVTGKYSHSLMNKQLAVSVQTTWLLNESALELYDYKRNLTALNLQWNF